MYVIYFEHTLSIALKTVKYLQSLLETQGFKSLSIEASENFSKPVLSSYFLLSLHIFVSRKLRSDQGQPLRKAMDGKVGEIIILLALLPDIHCGQELLHLIWACKTHCWRSQALTDVSQSVYSSLCPSTCLRVSYSSPCLPRCLRVSYSSPCLPRCNRISPRFVTHALMRPLTSAALSCVPFIVPSGNTGSWKLSKHFR